MDRVARIIELEERISGEYDRWEQAELIAEELATGTTQRALAEAIGKGLAHINYMRQVWLTFGVHLGEQERSSRTFDSYYKEIQRGSKKRPDSDSENTSEDNEDDTTDTDDHGSDEDTEPPENTEETKRKKLIAKLNEALDTMHKGHKQLLNVSYTRSVDKEVETTLVSMIDMLTLTLETVRKLK